MHHHRSNQPFCAVEILRFGKAEHHQAVVEHRRREFYNAANRIFSSGAHALVALAQHHHGVVHRQVKVFGHTFAENDSLIRIVQHLAAHKPRFQLHKFYFQRGLHAHYQHAFRKLFGGGKGKAFQPWQGRFYLGNAAQLVHPFGVVGHGVVNHLLVPVAFLVYLHKAAVGAHHILNHLAVGAKLHAAQQHGKKHSKKHRGNGNEAAPLVAPKVSPG